jgi:hypothetical protein
MGNQPSNAAVPAAFQPPTGALPASKFYMPEQRPFEVALNQSIQAAASCSPTAEECIVPNALPWDFNARNPVPDDVLYLVKTISRASYGLSITDDAETIKKKLQKQGSMKLGFQPQQIHIHNVAIPEQWVGKLPDSSLHNPSSEYPGEYYTIITKQNLKDYVPYGEWTQERILLVFARDALSEYDYHINTADFYGASSLTDTYYPWELNAFVKDADVRSASKRSYNEVVFHDPLDWQKTLKHVVVPSNTFKSDMKTHGLTEPVELSAEEKLNFPFTKTHKPMLPQLCHPALFETQGTVMGLTPGTKKRGFEDAYVEKLDEQKREAIELMREVCGTSPSVPDREMPLTVLERAHEIEQEGREAQNFMPFILAKDKIHRPGYWGVFTHGITGGYRSSFYGVRHLGKTS